MSATALMFISSAVQAIGAIRQGRAEAAAAEVEAASMERQAQISREQAQREAEVAALNIEEQRRETSRIIGSGRALLGASGFELSEGAPLLLLANLAAEGERQVLKLRSEGSIRERRFQQEAQTQMTQAAIRRQEGKNVRSAGFLKVGTSLLTGAAGFKLGDGGPSSNLAPGTIWHMTGR